MQALKKITTHEQFISGKNGKVQYVIIPADEYNKIVDLIEDYGLGAAMKKALKDKMYTRAEALKFLANDWSSIRGNIFEGLKTD